MRVTLHRHPKQRGFYVAHVGVPMIVGDIPGSTRVSCIADTKSGALAAAAALAQEVASNPTIGAVIPEGTDEDLDCLQYLATATRAGVSALKAAAHLMPTHRDLARILMDEARQYGNAQSLDAAAAVGGFFDDLSSLASQVAHSVVNYADPDHWPKWMQQVAKPLSRVALDAAATAVLGPAGPVMVETAMKVADQAQQGDPDATKTIEALAHKALDGDKKAKVLMSAVRSAASDNVKALGDAADDYMAQWGAAMDPSTWRGMDQGYGDNTAAPSPYGDNTSAMLSPQDVMALQAAAGYGYGQPGYVPAYGYGPQMPPQYGPLPYAPPYGYPDPYGQQYDAQAQGYPPGTTLDANGWPYDAQGNPWPQDQQGNPMDPSAQQAQPGAGWDNTPVRVHAGGHQGGPGARGGGVTITQGAPRGGSRVTGGGSRGGGWSGARDQRGGSRSSTPNYGGMFGQARSYAQQMANRNPRDHRGH